MRAKMHTAATEKATTFMSADAAALRACVEQALASWAQPAGDRVLFVAASKTLPRAELVGVLDACTAYASTRVGVLVPALPAALVPGERAPQHAVALASWSSADAVPFRSTIPGTPRIAVGRYASLKEAWHKPNVERVARLDDTHDWSSLWGRENVDGQLPPALEGFAPDEIGAVLLATDAHPHGLLEGLDARFGQAPLLGVQAALTAFETGREYTMLGGDRAIYDNGAVGVALRRRSGARRITRHFEHLQPIGTRLAVTGYVSPLTQRARQHHFVPRGRQCRAAVLAPRA